MVSQITTQWVQNSKFHPQIARGEGQKHFFVVKLPKVFNLLSHKETVEALLMCAIQFKTLSLLYEHISI